MMRNGITVFAALIATSLVATPMVIGATQAFAIADPAPVVTKTVAVSPVEIAPVVAAAVPEVCAARKVRVVYSGYAPTPTGCLTQAR